MKNFKCGLLAIILSIPLLLAGCGGDESSVTSGGGGSGVISDGGSGSAEFAGTYVGTIRIIAEGSEVDTDSTQAATLLVRSDGTARLTIDGADQIEGVVSGNTFGFSVRVVEEDGLIECDANATLMGSISGASATGTLMGSGECEIITATTGFGVSGSFTATRT